MRCSRSRGRARNRSARKFSLFVVSERQGSPMGARLSIVVPFYNVERYVLACLESLQRQSFSDFEVILVDDGSADSTFDLAASFCSRDNRFRIVRQENQGLGPARNTGVRQAQGEYLTFVDSDDLVPRHAYELMIRSLEESGSDFAAGDARRFNELGVRDSYVHKLPFAKERIGTSVREFPPLALDRMAWNKVYRRSFWDDHNLEFPAIMYEDYPVTIKSHVRAKSVDLLSSPVYYWREREGGELSITQRKWEMANLRDRVVSAEMVLDFLAEEAPELLPVVEEHFLHIDISALAAALHENEESSLSETLALADRLYCRTSQTARAAVIAFDRVQNHLLAHRQLDALRQLIDYRAERGTSAPIVRRGRFRPRYFYELPYLGDEQIGVPSDLYEAADSDLALTAVVRDSYWADGLLKLELAAYIDDLPMGEDSRVSVWLENSKGQWTLCAAERSWGTRQHFKRDLSVLRVEVDPRALGSGDARGFWKLMVRVRTEGISREGSFRRVAPGRAKWPATEVLEPWLWARPETAHQQLGASGEAHRGARRFERESSSQGYGLSVRRVSDAVTRCVATEDEICVEGRYTADEFDPAPVLRLALKDGAEPLLFSATSSEGAGNVHGFSVRVPVRDLIAHGDHDDPVEEFAAWRSRLLANGSTHVLAQGPDAATAACVLGSRRISTTTGPLGNFVIREEFAHPRIESIVWGEHSQLILRGAHDRSDALPRSALLRRYITPAVKVDVDLLVEVYDRQFEIVVDVPTLIGRAIEVRARDERQKVTPWHILFPFGFGLEPATVERDRVAALAGPARVDGHDVRVEVGRSDRVRLLIG